MSENFHAENEIWNEKLLNQIKMKKFDVVDYGSGNRPWMVDYNVCEIAAGT